MSGKGKGKKPIIDDDDIDNMDFGLPEELLNAPASSFPAFQQQPGSPNSPDAASFKRVNMDPALAQTMKKWVCVYPVYIDAGKTMSEGRRIPKELAVKEPAAVYMAESLRHLGLMGALEADKRHPRDPFTFGRIRVQLRTPDGRLCNPAVTNKRELLVRMAALLPQVEADLKKSDPRVTAMAAASRSEISKTVLDMAHTAVKEIKEGSTGGSNKKKGKKKK
ncbi:hypothetical protein HK102_003265 [Quaeritorhiza haematococci]|nr:hypothetical protein HK102_003265 [Quaeritorhiza haematococci]